jgi:hypothetical protein
MSQVQVAGGGSGTGVFQIVSPNSNTNRTQTLADATGTIVLDSATQTLTNKTLGTGLVAGASLITSGTAVASTSGTSIDFSSIPSWVKRITVMLNGVSTSGSSQLRFQVGSGSISSSGYGYSTVGATAGQGTSGSNVTNGSGFDLSQYSSAVSASSIYIGTATFVLFGSNTWVSTIMIGQTTNGVSGLISGITPALSSALDRVRITTVNGTDTFDAGSINILYE